MVERVDIAETLTKAMGLWSLAGMSYVLDHQKQQQVLGLDRLGWPVRRIAEATVVDRATARGYLLAVGVRVRTRVVSKHGV